MSWTRIRAIFRKEVREYQRNRSIVLTMAVIPLVFVAGPLINIFALPPDAAGQLRVRTHPRLHAGHPGDRAGGHRVLFRGRRTKSRAASNPS